MKKHTKTIFVASLILFGAFQLCSVSVHAQTSQEVFNTTVSELQDCEKNALGGIYWPTTKCNALREKVVVLAQQMKPPPPVPEAARRHIVRGIETVRSARSQQDFFSAESEFRYAIDEAPWLGVAYLNHAIVDIRLAELEEAQFPGASSTMFRYGRARRFLKLYLLTNPPPDDAAKARDMIYKVEVRIEKLR